MAKSSCHDFVKSRKVSSQRLLTLGYFKWLVQLIFGKDEYYYNYTSLQFWLVKNTL